MGFSNFCVLSYFLENSLFLGLLKHYKNRGFSRFLCFFVFERKKATKRITGISEFVFFCPKMAVSWRLTFFQKIGWNPYFYSVLGSEFSEPRCQKRQFLDTLSKHFWLITEKLFFGIFVFFTFSFLVFFFWVFLLFLFCLFCCFLFCFFGGFKGQVRWPKGPPHLALNPPYFFVFVFVVFFGGFKGQVRWPKGPPHLALNPPYLLFVSFDFCFFFLCFPFFVFNRQKTCFPPRKGHFLFIFNVSLSFSLNLFCPPPFSFSLSLSLSFSCLSSFLLVFLFALFLFLVFVSFSFFFLLCFCFMKRTTWTLSIAISFFPEIFSLSFGFLSCFFFPIPFSYLCFSWF